MSYHLVWRGQYNSIYNVLVSHRLKQAMQIVGFLQQDSLKDPNDIARRIINDFRAMIAPMSINPVDAMQMLSTSHAATQHSVENLVVEFLTAVRSSLCHTLTEDAFQELLSHQLVSCRTLLHTAAALGHFYLVSHLVNLRVNKDCCDANGYTALHFATLYDHIQCVEALLKAGADVGITNVFGQRVRDIALEHGHDAIAALLMPLSTPNPGALPSPTDDGEHFQQTKADTESLNKANSPSHSTISLTPPLPHTSASVLNDTDDESQHFPLAPSSHKRKLRDSYRRLRRVNLPLLFD